MPLDTVNRIWYKDIEGIVNMQVLIPPPNKVIFHKANGERGVGGRDKCAFFVYGMNDVIPQSFMLIEDGTGKIIPHPDKNPETAVPTYNEEDSQESGGDREGHDEVKDNMERLVEDTTVFKTRSGRAYERMKKAVRAVANSIPDIVAEQDESIATQNTIKAIRCKRTITIITESGDNLKSFRKIAEDSQSYGDAFELGNDDKAIKGLCPSDSQPM